MNARTAVILVVGGYLAYRLWWRAGSALVKGLVSSSNGGNGGGRALDVRAPVKAMAPATRGVRRGGCPDCRCPECGGS